MPKTKKVVKKTPAKRQGNKAVRISGTESMLVRALRANDADKICSILNQLEKESEGAIKITRTDNSVVKHIASMNDFKDDGTLSPIEGKAVNQEPATINLINRLKQYNNNMRSEIETIADRSYRLMITELPLIQVPPDSKTEPTSALHALNAELDRTMENLSALERISDHLRKIV